MYKNAFETVASQLSSTALQIIHELILAESRLADFEKSLEDISRAATIPLKSAGGDD